MAEVLAAEIAKSLLGKLASLAVGEFYLAWRLEAYLERLEEKLSTITAVLSDAERQQSQNDKIRLWLEKLREVLYDAEDVLDEFECEALRNQVVKTEGSTRRKVRRSCSTSNKLAFRLKMGHKIKGLIHRLSEIASLKSDFGLSEQSVDVHFMQEEIEIRQSFESFSGLIGRDKDREHISSLLLKPFKVGDAHPFVISIVGMGGLGKTALAKSVYDDESVNAHFELKMQACVSDGFTVKQVTAKIIESVTGKKCNDLGEGELTVKLEAILSGRKYLLLLDDVWNEDPHKWLLFKPLFSKGAFGSKIVVTTRNQRVAEIMGNVDQAYELSVLDQEDCLSLFYKCAFKEGQVEQQHPNLVEIGREIVEKCKQIPLAVINLGTQLYGKVDEREWKLVRDSETWEEKEDGILPALKISYQRLPTHLKKCFLYCSIFPKDYELRAYTLVQFWMAHGLVQSSNPNENLEDVGLRYVRELISKCFFQDVEDAFWTQSFKMHDLIHDLASSLAKNECSVINSQKQPISKTARHLSVLDSDSFFHQALPKFPNAKLDRVRTLLFASDIDWPSCRTEFENCLSECKHLRTLEIMDDCELLPEKIGALKHLRYLKLFSSLKFRLPKSIFKLQNLQSLFLLGGGLEELPEDVRYLISLRYLFVISKQKRFLEGGIGCLECLQSLFIVLCENLEYLCEDMQGLKSLRKLVIVGCKSLISVPRSMKYLTALEVLFIGACEKLDLMTMEEEKEVKIKPLSLQSLAFLQLPATLALPRQFLQGSMDSLQTFSVVHCPNIRELPECIGDLKKLQKLGIRGCPGLSERCQRRRGEDWPKIAHIPGIDIDGVNIQQTC